MLIIAFSYSPQAVLILESIVTSGDKSFWNQNATKARSDFFLNVMATFEGCILGSQNIGQSNAIIVTVSRRLAREGSDLSLIQNDYGK